MSLDAPDVLSLAKEGDLIALASLSSEEMLLCGTGSSAVRDKYDGYCVHWAAGCGHLSCLKWLVEVAGADPSVQCKGSGRQPAHYAARNGHLDCLKYLLDNCMCDLNALAKHDVTPLQLAVWQNQIHVADFLCSSTLVQACPLQVNSFACSLVHWLATATPEVGGEGGVLLLPMAEWLLEKGCDFFATQRSGHTVLHKAAWGGHAVLCRWLHYKLGATDSVTDNAGNYAADCARMGRHYDISDWLRSTCSTQRGESLRTLGVEVSSLSRETAQVQALILGERSEEGGESGDAEDAELVALIRTAYLEKARQCHPDRNRGAEASEEFVKVQRAYKHLTVHGGRGQQRNERHDIKIMIAQVAVCDATADAFRRGNDSEEGHEEGKREREASAGGEGMAAAASPLMFFKARLLATLLDYGSCGMPASSLRKKWNEIWPDDNFPTSLEMHAILDHHSENEGDNGAVKGRSRNKFKKIKVLSFLKTIAADCCRIDDSQPGSEPLLFAIEPP